jgi:hypothetical protein
LIVGLSYNQPKFCASATWNPNATTFANSSTVGINPYGLFINSNNTIYVADRSLNRILAWFEGDMIPTKIFSGNLATPFAIFATTIGDVYVDNGLNEQVDKWTFNATDSDIAIYVNAQCFGLFIDVNDSIYCSLPDLNQVIKQSLNDSTNTSIIVAGNGTSGSDSNMLNNPHGIFININLDLYVADRDNHRVQLFISGEFSATTVAGGDAPGTIALQFPTGIVLDGNGYLFISDTNNNRIVGSGPDGFRCIVGCSTISGTESDQLDSPWSISFDSYGNLFVADAYNNRIQKFLLQTNCGEC